MIDQELLSEPTNGADSTFTADGRSEHDGQPEAHQSRTASAARRLADSVTASSRGRLLAQELARQNNRMERQGLATARRLSDSSGGRAPGTRR